MNSQSNTYTLSFLRIYVRGASLIAIGMGCAVLTGWFFNIIALKSISPGLATMKANTALSFIFLGISLWLLHNENPSLREKYVAWALAMLVVMLGSLTFSEYIFDWDLRIDQFLFKDLLTPSTAYPGRMSEITAVCFILSGLSLLLIGFRASQYFSILVTFLSLLALIGYFFDYQSLYHLAGFNPVALHTAFTFLFLSLGTLAARPTRGMMKVFSSDLSGSRTMRLMLPASIIITLILGSLVEAGERLKILNPGSESVVLVLLLILVYSPLIYFNAKNINQADEALRLNEHRFRALTENSWDSVALFGTDGTILYGSPSTPQILGYELDEFVGRNAFELIHHDDQAFVTERLMLSIQKPSEHVSVYARFLHKNGSWRWLEGTFTNLLQEPAVQAIVNNYHDFTERHEAEEQIRYQVHLLAHVNDAIVASDENYILKAWNAAAEKMYGWTADEVIGRKGGDILQTQFPGAETAEMRRQIAETGPYIGEATQLRKDGTRIAVEVASMVLHDEVGQITGYVSVNRDITERKRAEEQIQRQLKYLSGLRMIDIAISSSFDLHVIFDVVLQQVLSQLGVDASALLLFNAQLQKIEYAASRGLRSEALYSSQLKMGEGYASQVLLKRKTIHISRLMEPVDKLAKALASENEEFVEYYGTPLIAKGEVKGVLEVYHRSQLQISSEWLEFLETLAGQAAIAIDNAQLFEGLQRSNANLERRVAERTAELNHTNAELEHANQTKDEFLANMSHELRTPLTSILGMSESLLEQRRGSLNEYQQKSLEVIESSGRHLLELINDILDLSKIEAGKFDFYPQPISVQETCRSSLAFIKTQAAKKSITVTFINETSVAKIYADPRRLKQILVNLLTNAVKFTFEKGKVILRVTTIPEQDLIQFSVIDNGIGIATEDLQRLFQPFVQVDSSLNRQYEGTGLGLALVQRLTDLHGGSVRVESEIGKGSRFTVNLAIKQDEITKLENPESHDVPPFSEQAEKIEMPLEAPKHLGMILLADDNMANILTMGEYLESQGYEIVVAHNGVEAIEKAETINPDIILMDVQMPSMNGLDAIARLRGNPDFASTPIIALTALAMPGDRERCLQAGASEYMSKPVSLKTLRQTIEILLHT